jgi:hypothetical protein
MDAGYIYDNNELLLEEGIDLSKEKQITRELIDKVNKVNYCHGFECVDLSRFDLTNLSLEDISNITFDERTKWPGKDKLPDGFDPQILLETRKGIYPGIKSLHKDGINGRGVNVVYIDQQNKFVFNHDEFKHLNYEYFDFNGYDLDEFHPYGVLSNLCGTNTGVAPNINLLYYSAFRWKEYDESMLASLCDVLEKIESGNEIDVVGVSGPIYYRNKGEKTAAQQKIDEVVEKIEKYGCVVIDGYRFLDNFTCCGVIAEEDFSYYDVDFVSWASEEDKMKPAFICKGQVIAEWQTTNQYVYQGTNCDSWPIAQCVGLFALCRQVNKKITYEDFLNAVKKSTLVNNVISFDKCIEHVRNLNKKII